MQVGKLIIESHEPIAFCPIVAHKKGGQSVLASATVMGFTDRNTVQQVVAYLKQYLRDLLDSGCHKLLRTNRKAEIFDSIELALKQLEQGETNIYVSGGGHISISIED